MRILLVEDEQKLCELIARALKAERYAVDTSFDGQGGLEMANTYEYDLLILDLMLPNMSGTEVLRRVRRKNQEVPIIILTARDAMQEKVQHFEAGADDYLTKPFAFAELIMRVKALLRRGPLSRATVLRVGDLEMDRLAQQVRRNGMKIELTPKEYALLEYLASNPGRVFSRTMIIEHVLDDSLTVLFLRHYLEANLLDIQARRARQIADTLLVAAPRTGEATVAQQVEELYSPEANDRLIRITRADGHVVYASGYPKDRSFDPAQVPPPPLTRDGRFSRKEFLPNGALLVAALPYTGTGNSRYVVEVGVSNSRTEATLRQVLLMLAIGLPTAVCVAVAGGFVLMRRALRPVDQIAHKAEEITQHNLSERVPVVQTAPLTVLRGELEGLAQDTQLKLQTRETLGSMLEEVDRLAEIVEGLLALSRLDAGEAHSEWVPFDLAELAATTADQMGLLAEDKNITVICDSARGINVEGDRARMKQVVVNLLDNAIKYTPNGGRVRLNVTREDGCAVPEVADEGIGIPPDALPHVFKRFYRVDGSRSRDQGGAGLGLSIVKSICTAHGAQVEVVSIPGKGSRFRIRQLLVNTSVHAHS